MLGPAPKGKGPIEVRLVTLASVRTRATEDRRAGIAGAWYPSPMRRADALSLISGHLPEFRRRFGVRELAVFGSTARDEATPASDVDVLVEFEGPTTFDGYFGVKEALEGFLGTHVDLATPAMLPPRLKLEVDREGVRVA